MPRLPRRGPSARVPAPSRDPPRTQMPDTLESRFQTLHEFVKAARTNLNRNVWDYLIGGAETETTLARNRMALDALAFRPRVLNDVSGVDAGGSLFGRKLRIPVLLAPVGSLQ